MSALFDIQDEFYNRGYFSGYQKAKNEYQTKILKLSGLVSKVLEGDGVSDETVNEVLALMLGEDYAE